jgi:deoxyribonuclease-4
LVGAHVSTAGGFARVPDRALAIAAEAVQVFSSNPRTWRAAPPDTGELRDLRVGLAHHGLPLFLHTIYLINLASFDERLRARSGQLLAHALVTGALAGAAGVVTHIGSHQGSGFERVAGLVVEAVRAALKAAKEQIPAGRRSARIPPLLLETGAGSGNTIGNDLAELAYFLEALPPATGLCLDTAHLFAAGYPIHTPKGLESLIVDLQHLRLLTRAGLVHLNDSATPFASRRVRHENPGAGHIGLAGLARVVRHPALIRIPFVLEVPGPDKRGASAVEVEAVKRMRRATPTGVAAPSPP